jgi:YidC/Oxa1 family membrane protein insertase
VFVPFVLNFTTGVMIYWITSNFWTIGQQGMIKRTMGHRFPQPAAKGGSSGKGGDKGGGSSGKGAEKGGGGKGGGKPVGEASSAPRPRGAGRRTSQQPGRRSGQRRGGRKR